MADNKCDISLITLLISLVLLSMPAKIVTKHTSLYCSILNKDNGPIQDLEGYKNGFRVERVLPRLTYRWV